jgi:hypothetical protein
MPFDDKAKLEARIFVDHIRANTICENCGKQPIEYHRPEHEENSNDRVAHLVALGFSIDRIKMEIALCKPLCRSCHMKEDGRIERLHDNCPNKKGMELVPPIHCIKCNKLTKPTWKKMCRSCYDFQRRHN